MKFKITAIVISLLYIPLSFYLSYLVLQRIQTTDLMWFLFWFSIPFAVILSIVAKLAEWEE